MSLIADFTLLLRKRGYRRIAECGVGYITERKSFWNRVFLDNPC
jgi:hypothetical protein